MEKGLALQLSLLIMSSAAMYPHMRIRSKGCVIGHSAWRTFKLHKRNEEDELGDFGKWAGLGLIITNISQCI